MRGKNVSCPPGVVATNRSTSSTSSSSSSSPSAFSCRPWTIPDSAGVEWSRTWAADPRFRHVPGDNGPDKCPWQLREYKLKAFCKFASIDTLNDTDLADLVLPAKRHPVWLGGLLAGELAHANWQPLHSGPLCLRYQFQPWGRNHFVGTRDECERCLCTERTWSETTVLTKGIFDFGFDFVIRWKYTTRKKPSFGYI